MSTKKIILTATAIAALAGPAAAQARQGADDPVGHVRHSGDDVRGAHHTSSATHRHRARHGRRGVHHSATGVRRGGADDGPNHT
jgi:Ni/Co efflux regulator RcnB